MQKYSWVSYTTSETSNTNLACLLRLFRERREYRQWIMNMYHDKTCRTTFFEQLQTVISIDIYRK